MSVSNGAKRTLRLAPRRRLSSASAASSGARLVPGSSGAAAGRTGGTGGTGPFGEAETASEARDVLGRSYARTLQFWRLAIFWRGPLDFVLEEGCS